jgi:hypothetical protein
LSRNQASGLIRLNADLKDYYDANRDRKLSSLYPLTRSMLKGDDDKCPSLKSKAAECRHLADFAVVLANRHRYGNPGRSRLVFRGRMRGKEEQHYSGIVDACEGMVAYQASVTAPEFNAHTCKQAMYVCLQGLARPNRLWREGLPEAEKAYQPFPIKPKAHMLQHLCEDKLPIWGSPSNSWCYRDEDYIGSIKKIAALSSHPRTLEQRVMEKLLILSGMGFSA